jgi:methionyl-tRNA formyltransferase
MRIIFMGTPEFAVSSLEILLKNHYNVVAVVTAPDKPAGRNLQLASSEVKKKALEYGLPILQPTNLKDPAFIEQLKSFQADIQIVIAFRMLPEVVWNMPPLGTFNLHASLLPAYRGAAPINWAIINGEKETGLTTFFLKHEIDTGDIILQQKEPIYPTDNVGTLYERLMNKGAELLLATVKLIETKQYTLKKQEDLGVVKHAPKIFKETCQINFQQSVEAVHNFVRGLSPYPAAWFMLQGKLCKVFRTTFIQEQHSITAGELQTDHKTYLHIATADGWLVIEELQLEGKKKMGVVEFLRGFRA